MTHGADEPDAGTGQTMPDTSGSRAAPDVPPPAVDAPTHAAAHDATHAAAQPLIEVEPTQAAGRRRRNLFILASAAIVLLALSLYWLFGPARKTTETTGEEATAAVVSVRVAQVTRQPLAAEVAALGTIFPRAQATVAANLGAQIKQMRLLQNTVVRAGQVIAVLETRDLQAQRAEAVAALQSARAQARGVTTGAIPQATAQANKDVRDARANVANARALYERRRALYEQGGIARKEVEAAQLTLDTAENALRLAERTLALRTAALSPNEQAVAAANIRQAQQRVAATDAQLSYATIRAPLTGIVTEQFQFQGEYATPGGRLVNIADISEVIVKAQFADSVVAQLKVGDAATVLPTDLTGERMTGQVSLISHAADPLNRSVEVWVRLGNGAGRLRAGGAAEVRIATNQAGAALVVPAAAVTLDASNAASGTVMVVGADAVAHETPVTIGLRTPAWLEITSGLQGGETVVVEGNYALPDGTKVEVQDAAPAAGAEKEAQP